MTTLALCVPHYKEETKIVKDFLNSVRLQQNVNFEEIEVVIVNDGGDYSQLEDIDTTKYPFYIKIIIAPHQGVSAARNKAFDESNSKYVMFCDIDDMFYTPTALFSIFEAIKNKKFNVLISVFKEEHRDNDGKPYYINRDADVFVHGKVYNRQYLLDINLRFNPALTVHEDFYFNFLAINLCEDKTKAIKLNTPIYLWKWQNNSVSRGDKEYIYKTYPNMLDSCTEVINQLLKRLKIQLASVMANRVIYDCYFTMNKKEWLNQENKEYRRIVEKRFRKFYEDFKEVCKVLPEKEKNKLILGIRSRLYKEGMYVEQITFADWIKRIEEA